MLSTRRSVFVIDWIGLPTTQKPTPEQIKSKMQEAVGYVEKGDYEKARDIYQYLAGHGHLEAVYCLGVVHNKPDNTGKNPVAARYCFEHAGDHFEALVEAGKMWHKGVGGEKDDESAEERFRKALKVAKDNPIGEVNYQLGKLFGDKDKETGKAKDVAQAISFYREAIEEYCDKAYSKLGLIYQEQGKFADAILFYKEGAKQNDGKACLHLGLCHENGIGTQKNPIEAATCCEKALKIARETGDEKLAKRAQNQLNNLQEIDSSTKKEKKLDLKLTSLIPTLLTGTKRTEKQAASEKTKSLVLDAAVSYQEAGEYKRAAELYTQVHENFSGIPEAAFHLAVLYNKGLGVKKDHNKAYALFESAALEEHEKALDALATMYLATHKVASHAEAFFKLGKQYGSKPETLNLGIALYNKAIRLGNVDAMINLGVLNETYGDLNFAFQCYHLAADLNSPAGLVNVGLIYSAGKGVTVGIPQSDVYAIPYFEAAIDKCNAMRVCSKKDTKAKQRAQLLLEKANKRLEDTPAMATTTTTTTTTTITTTAPIAPTRSSSLPARTTAPARPTTRPSAFFPGPTDGQ